MTQTLLSALTHTLRSDLCTHLSKKNEILAPKTGFSLEDWRSVAGSARTDRLARVEEIREKERTAKGSEFDEVQFEQTWVQQIEEKKAVIQALEDVEPW